MDGNENYDSVSVKEFASAIRGIGNAHPDLKPAELEVVYSALDGVGNVRGTGVLIFPLKEVGVSVNHLVRKFFGSRKKSFARVALDCYVKAKTNGGAVVCSGRETAVYDLRCVGGRFWKKMREALLADREDEVESLLREAKSVYNENGYESLLGSLYFVAKHHGKSYVVPLLLDVGGMSVSLFRKKFFPLDTGRCIGIKRAVAEKLRLGNHFPETEKKFKQFDFDI